MDTQGADAIAEDVHFSQDHYLSEDDALSSDVQEKILAELGFTEPFESWTGVFATLCARSLGDLRQSLTDFIHSSQNISPSESLEPVDCFLQAGASDDWPNFDDAISTEWEQVLRKVHKLSYGQVDTRYMTKPTGPLMATLAFIWHYPTFRSGRIIKGATFDPSNPSLRWLAKKIGLDSSVRVQNRIFLRHKFEKHVDWHAEIPNWTLIEEEFLAFNRWLNRFSRVIVVVGEANCQPDSIQRLVPVQEGEEIVKVIYQVNCQMFGGLPYCAVVRNKATKEIRQLILLSYHSQAWLADHLRVIPALHDCLYNAACEMAQIWYEDGLLFSRDAFRIASIETKRHNTQRFTPATIVAQERTTGMRVSETYLRQNFSVFIAKHPQLFQRGFPQKNGSYAEGLLDVMRYQGKLTQASQGYPCLVRGAQTHAGKGFPNLKQGRLTQAAKGYPNLQRGHQSQSQQNAAVREGKVAALLQLKQVRELLARYDSSQGLPKAERKFCEIIRAFDAQDASHREWLKQTSRKCVFWTPATPLGIRHKNDGCTDPDLFDYDNAYHPAFKMKGRFTMSEIKGFSLQAS